MNKAPLPNQAQCCAFEVMDDKTAGHLLDKFWVQRCHLPHSTNASGELLILEGAESDLCPWDGPPQTLTDLLMRNITKTSAQQSEVIAYS